MEQPAPGALPGALRAAVLLIAAQAVAVGLIAAFLVYEDVTATATNLAGALFVTGFASVVAITLGAVARALHRRRGGVRGLAVVLQLMLMPIGYYMIKGGLAWLGVPLMGLGLLVCALLVTPASTRALGLDSPRRAG